MGRVTMGCSLGAGRGVARPARPVECAEAAPTELVPWQSLDPDQRRAYLEIATVRTGHRGIRFFVTDELGVLDD